MNALAPTRIARDLAQVPQLADLDPDRFTTLVDTCGVVDRLRAFERAMDSAFAAIDASKAKTSRLAELSLIAVAIADDEVGPRSDAVTHPADPVGFIQKAQHNAAWNAIYRREAARLMGAARIARRSARA